MIEPMSLQRATRFAEKLSAWLGEHCERIEIAGSIRRRRSSCNDVDLVCIPRVIERKDMLGEIIERRNVCRAFLKNYVAASAGKSRFISGGEKDGKQVLIELPLCQLDLWFATPETFATRLLCRTGSKEHNIWLAQRADDFGGHWNPYDGLTLNGKTVKADIEEDIYRALKVPWIDPQNREIDWILKNVK